MQEYYTDYVASIFSKKLNITFLPLESCTLSGRPPIKYRTVATFIGQSFCILQHTCNGTEAGSCAVGGSAVQGAEVERLFAGDSQ